MNTESILSDENGRLKIHTDERPENEHIYMVFMSGGLCSSYMLKHLCDMILGKPDQYFYIINCSESQKQVEAIEKVVQFFQSRNNRLYVTDFKACSIGDPFSTIEDWLPKFVRDIIKEEFFDELTINIGFNTSNFYEIKTNDEAINKMIQYPLVERDYDYYRILKRTLHFFPERVKDIMICENTKVDGYCKKCIKCNDLNIMLRMVYMTYPVDEVKFLAKQLYEDIFETEMVTDGFVVMANPDGTCGLVDPNDSSRNCLCCPPDKKSKFKKIIYNGRR